VIFQTFPASQGAQNCSPSRLGSSHSPSPITEFAPEPMSVAGDNHHRLAERARMRPAGQFPDQPPPLPGRQAGIGGLADQLVTKQGHPVRTLGPPLFFLGA
jgi:hypothetical protein